MEQLSYLCHAPRHVNRGQELLPNPTRSIIVLDGYCRSYRTFANGKQVIFDFRVPGDVACLRNILTGRTRQCLAAASDAVVCIVPTRTIQQLIGASPPLRKAFMERFDAEDANLQERFSHIARSSALTRMASLLLNLLERLEPVGLVKNLAFRLSVTQDDLADALGLTPVHVNRTLRQLRDMRVADIVKGCVTIHNLSALKELAA